MIGDWVIRHLPRCTHHVFLSHCAEDRDRLIVPVYEALEDRRYFPWLDKHHYPSGQAAFEALREGILHCRHVVYFVTARFLSQGRGWNSVENAYANLLQDNLHFQSLELCHVHLPLFFLPRDHVILHRSAWGTLLHRGRYYSSGRVDSGAAAWATEQIVAFIRQEENRGASLAEQIPNDPGYQRLLAAEPNLLRRIMCADPPSIP
ncbi:MAG: toll/interleukin-1 receptor domain-containing protein [Gemmataceae bacterium]